MTRAERTASDIERALRRMHTADLYADGFEFPLFTYEVTPPQHQNAKRFTPRKNAPLPPAGGWPRTNVAGGVERVVIVPRTR